jgi:hypothetical protein
MTINEIAYNIKNIVEGGIAGDDSNLSITQIKYMVNYHRAQLLTKYTDSGRFVSDAMLSTRSTANATGSMSMPAILGWPNNRAIKEVTLVETDGKIHNLPIINPSEKDFFLASRFAPNQNQFFSSYSLASGIQIHTSDGSVFSDNSQNIVVKAVLENPQVTNWSSGSYPIPPELISALTETLLAKEFNIYLRTSADASNNALDERASKMPQPRTQAAPNANARSRKARTR